MNLFWKRIFRLMNSTASYEKKLGSIQLSSHDDSSNVNQTDFDDKLELELIVQSKEFQDKKKLYQNRKYKDTDEYRIVRQYEKLLKDNNIKWYFETKNSQILQEYLSFKTNPDSLNLKDLSIIEVSEKIEKLKQFEQSKSYQIYTQYHDSLAVREFEELRKKIADPEFQQNNAFWANSNRWETTLEYRQEARYKELNNEFVPKNKSKDKTSLFKRYSQIYLKLNELFDWNTIEESIWLAGFHSGNPMLLGNYAFVNEQQGHSGGNNVSSSEGVMTIHTVDLPMKSLAWDVQKGFVERDFRYSSDVVQTAAAFRQRYGVFSVKVKSSGNIHHAVWLGSERKLPHINIYYFNGKSITVGNANLHRYDGIELKGLAQDEYYVFTLEWTPRSLVWYVNNVEVFRTNENIPNESLYVGVNSFIPAKAEADIGKLELDWLKVYEVRN